MDKNEAIYHVRKALELNQTEFASKAGAHQGHVSAYETKAAKIRWEKFFLMMNRLKIKVKVSIIVNDQTIDIATK